MLHCSGGGEGEGEGIDGKFLTAIFVPGLAIFGTRGTGVSEIYLFEDLCLHRYCQ